MLIIVNNNNNNHYCISNTINKNKTNSNRNTKNNRDKDRKEQLLFGGLQSTIALVSSDVSAFRIKVQVL